VDGHQGPSETPEPIVRNLSDIMIKMADPDVKEAMGKVGADTPL
jgi:hypothetical protein